MPSTE
jgi:hypothetical protein